MKHSFFVSRLFLLSVCLSAASAQSMFSPVRAARGLGGGCAIRPESSEDGVIKPSALMHSDAASVASSISAISHRRGADGGPCVIEDDVETVEGEVAGAVDDIAAAAAERVTRINLIAENPSVLNPESPAFKGVVTEWEAFSSGISDGELKCEEIRVFALPMSLRTRAFECVSGVCDAEVEFHAKTALPTFSLYWIGFRGAFLAKRYAVLAQETRDKDCQEKLLKNLYTQGVMLAKSPECKDVAWVLSKKLLPLAVQWRKHFEPLASGDGDNALFMKACAQYWLGVEHGLFGAAHMPAKPKVSISWKGYFGTVPPHRPNPFI